MQANDLSMDDMIDFGFDVPPVSAVDRWLDMLHTHRDYYQRCIDRNGQTVEYLQSQLPNYETGSRIHESILHHIDQERQKLALWEGLTALFDATTPEEIERADNLLCVALDMPGDYLEASGCIFSLPPLCVIDKAWWAVNEAYFLEKDQGGKFHPCPRPFPRDYPIVPWVWDGVTIT